MAYGRFRKDPCGQVVAAQRSCPRCFRHYMDAARERTMVHQCGVGVKEHYEERLAFAKASDDYAGWTDEIMRTFVRDLKGGIVPVREVHAIARMLDDASCEAATAAKAVA